MTENGDARAPHIDPDRLRRLVLGGYGVVAVSLLLFAGVAYAMTAMSDAVRAYVKGESLWSKGQKEAVIALQRYARTGEEASWDRYREALEVPLGDRKARLALQADPPRTGRAREGFRQGGLAPSEIGRMILAFRWLEDWGPMSRSIEIWAGGDSLIAELRSVAGRLRDEWREPPPDSAALEEILARLDALNDELDAAEKAFIEAISRVSERARHWSLVVVGALTLLLLAFIGGCARWLHLVIRRREQALRASEKRYRHVFEDSKDTIFITGREGSILDINPAGEELFGHPRDELLEMNAEEFYHDPAERRRFREIVDEQGFVGDFEVRLVTGDGEVRECLLTATARTEDGEVVGYQGIIRDVTERKAFERQLQHQALHDQLTDLPNRSLFRDRLRHGLERTKRQEQEVAVIFLDLDRFKTINDSFGHPAGDRVLRTVTERLRGTLREEDTVARVGGDEFAVLLEDVVSIDDIEGAVERIQTAFEPPFDVEGTQFSLSASMGVAHSGLGYDEPDELVRLADAAMYRVKTPGSTDYHIFDPAQDHQVTERLQREAALERAIHEDEIVVRYQPVYHLATREIGGAEALVRWEHPVRGLVPPGEFIPLAEESGLIVPLGRKVLEEALRQYRRWRDEGVVDDGFRVSVNFSARQYEESRLTDDLVEACEAAGVPLSALMVEITETVAMTGSDRLASLRERGLEVAIDDFGTGYASLEYLRHFTADVLKLDRSFIAHLDAGDQTVALVQGILDVADRMGLDVTAEGIEEERQLDLLREFGCPFGQGYLFARPMPADEFAELVREGATGKRETAG